MYQVYVFMIIDQIKRVTPYHIINGILESLHWILKILLMQSYGKHQEMLSSRIFTATFRGSEAVVQRCSVKKVFLKFSQNLQKNTGARVSFLLKLQVFSCEFCGISKNTYFYRTPSVAASEGLFGVFQKFFEHCTKKAVFR